MFMTNAAKELKQLKDKQREAVRKSEQKKKDQGLVKITSWVRKEHKETLKKFVLNLQRGHDE